MELQARLFNLKEQGKEEGKVQGYLIILTLTSDRLLERMMLFTSVSTIQEGIHRAMQNKEGLGNKFVRSSEVIDGWGKKGELLFIKNEVQLYDYSVNISSLPTLANNLLLWFMDKEIGEIQKVKGYNSIEEFIFFILNFANIRTVRNSDIANIVTVRNCDCNRGKAHVWGTKEFYSVLEKAVLESGYNAWGHRDWKRVMKTLSNDPIVIDYMSNAPTVKALNKTSVKRWLQYAYTEGLIKTDFKFF